MVTKGKAHVVSGYTPTICVITPTIGRPALKRALESARLSYHDRWMVILDVAHGDREMFTQIVHGMNKLFWPYIDLMPQINISGEYGNKLRDAAMQISENDYFLFLDDDDVFVPNAMNYVREEITRNYPRPIMFKMINGNGEILWKNREVTPGNVGTPMFCCPNIPGKLGVWDNGAGHRSDHEFIRTTLESHGDDWRQHLVWSDKVIVECRPGASSG